MLKKFFISMLGTMAGIWLSLIIICLGLLLIFGKMFMPDNKFLFSEKIIYISLEGAIPEYDDTPSIVEIVDPDAKPMVSFADLIWTLRAAAKDDLVKGVFIDCKGASLGVASRQELMEAIIEFRKSGKWCYAYADEFSQGDYFVASAADKVYLNPAGLMDIHGICATVLYFTDILENIGIGVDIVKVGDYKSAVEPFVRMDMSDADRKQKSVYVHGIWNTMIKLMAKNRGIKAEDFDLWADEFAYALPPDTFTAGKAVDRLLYRQEVEKEMRSRLGISSSDPLPYVTAYEYSQMANSQKRDTDKDHVAVLYAVGDIYTTGTTGISAEQIVPMIEKLANDEHVKGLVLRVNSGGGSAFASEQIWKALEYFKEAKKPFYVSMGDYAASGGYYISCGADRIYADATTLTGSIGIFGIVPNASELLGEKLKLGWDTVSTNANSAFPSLYYPLSPMQKEKLQTYVERGYNTFVDRVSCGRGLSADSVMAIGGGRVWDGRSALEIGLVDELGGLSSAINAMASKVGLASDAVVFYPERNVNLFNILHGYSVAGINIDFAGILENGAKDLESIMKVLRHMSWLQARMDYINLE